MACPQISIHGAVLFPYDGPYFYELGLQNVCMEKGDNMVHNEGMTKVVIAAY